MSAQFVDHHCRQRHSARATRFWLFIANDSLSLFCALDHCNLMLRAQFLERQPAERGHNVLTRNFDITIVGPRRHPRNRRRDVDLGAVHADEQPPLLFSNAEGFRLLRIHAKWFRLVGVSLGNATERYPHGDIVQTVEPWVPPDAWKDLGADVIDRILTDIDVGLPDGNRYTDAPNVKERAAWRVVVEHAPHKSEAQAREIIKTWVRNGVLMSETYDNPVTRQDVSGLRVNPEKRPT